MHCFLLNALYAGMWDRRIKQLSLASNISFCGRTWEEELAGACFCSVQAGKVFSFISFLHTGSWAAVLVWGYCMCFFTDYWVLRHAFTSEETTYQGETYPADFMAQSQDEPLFSPLKLHIFNIGKGFHVLQGQNLLLCHQHSPTLNWICHLFWDWIWTRIEPVSHPGMIQRLETVAGSVMQFHMTIVSTCCVVRKSQYFVLYFVSVSYFKLELMYHRH